MKIVRVINLKVPTYFFGNFLFIIRKLFLKKIILTMHTSVKFQHNRANNKAKNVFWVEISQNNAI